MRIDINCDLGESFGIYRLGEDENVLPHITSANVACGFHGGDPTVARRTIERACRFGVAVGAHPGFPDLAGFGRREMQATPREVEDFVLYQVAALGGLALAAGIQLQHVKPHGALYNMACRDEALAGAIARAVAAYDESLILFGLPGSALLAAGRVAGLRVAAEGFADRSYEPDGSLTPRSRAGSVIHDVNEGVQRAVRLAADRTIDAVDGSTLRLEVETICVHGDTPGAAERAARLRAGLERAGVQVIALGA
jgi:UPF0271 protein